jgi:hypothetical protein
MTIFWILWAGTAGLIGWQLVRAWQNSLLAFGVPAVAGIFWLYVYVFLPWQLVNSEPNALRPDQLVANQLLAFLCYASLCIGSNYGISHATKQFKISRVYDSTKLWQAGIVLQIIGLVGLFTFNATVRDFKNTSAYWYMAFNFCYPGLAICVALLASRPQMRTIFNYSLSIVFAGAVIIPFLVSARRGPSFVAVMAIGASYLLLSRRHAGIWKSLSLVVAAGVLMVVLVSARPTINNEGTWKEFFHTATTEEMLVDRGERLSDNEYYNSCLQVDANRSTGRYQYGTVHLMLPLNAIPRSWWPGKPNRGGGLFPYALEDVGPDSNLGHGGAIGCVADSFDNYGWAAPVYWFFIGWLVAIAYYKAIWSDDMHRKMFYVGILCSLHWFVAQSLGEAFVPFCIYQISFLLAFWYAQIPLIVKRPKRRSRHFGQPIVENGGSVS